MSYRRNVNNEGNYYILHDGVQYPLDKLQFVNDLGVIFDSQLRFDNHIESKINEAYSVLGNLRLEGQHCWYQKPHWNLLNEKQFKYKFNNGL
jgi:hypothetical protein